MKNYLILSILFAIATIYVVPNSFSQDANSVEGVWQGQIKGRHNRDFTADIGIKKVGDVYIIRGVSKDKRISWYGKGTFNGGTLEYTYKVRRSIIRGKGTLTLSKDKKMKLTGEFEEGVSIQRKGSETWTKVLIKSKEQMKKEQAEKDAAEKEKKETEKKN